MLLLFAVPTAAAQGDSPSDDITVEPTDDSVATIEDGEITVSVDVVPHATSTVDEAFRIRSTGDEEQRVWVRSGVEGVEFHRSDTGEPVERVTLDPGESVGVGLTVDSSQDLDGDFFTIRVQTDEREPASISVTDVAVEPRELVTGDAATITTTVENTGEAAGRQPVRLEIDGTVVAQRSVRLRGGETRTVAFERPFQRVGTFAVAVSTIRGVTTYTTEVVFQSQPVEVAAGEEELVTFTRRFSEEGRYAISVSGTDAGTVTVGNPGETPRRTAERFLANPGTSTVGLAALVGLLAVGRSSIWELVLRYV